MLIERILKFFYKLISLVGNGFIKVGGKLTEELSFESPFPVTKVKFPKLELNYGGIFSPVVENLLSPKVAFPLVFFIYLYSGTTSQVSFIFQRAFLTALLILLAVLVAYFVGIDLSKKVKVEPVKELNPRIIYNFAAGLLIIGILGWIFHYYFLGGLPILNPSLRGRNLLWMTSFIAFCFGSSLTTGVWCTNTAKGKLDRRDFWKRVIALILLIFILIGPNAYRVDLIVPLLAVIVTLTLFKFLRNLKVLLIGVGLLFVSAAQKFMFYLQQNKIPSLMYLTSSRAGFTLYSFSKIVKVSGISGLRGGNFFLSTLAGDVFFYIFKIPRIRGEIIGSEVIGFPKALTTTFAGPFVLDFGLLGPVLPAIFLGLLLGLAYKTVQKTDVENRGVPAVLYGLMLSISLIWVESGPARFYLIFIFLANSIYFVHRCIK